MKRQRRRAARPAAAPATPSRQLGPLRQGSVDDALLVRCRALWLEGDWAALTAFTLADFERHAQRERLALMLAAAQFALGAFQPARRAAEQAGLWGADRRLVARTLLAGVHNTLGRAAALGGQAERAWQHFAQASAPVAGARQRLQGLQGRGRRQLQALGLSLAPLPAPAAPPALAQAPLQALQQDLQASAGALQQGLARQAEALASAQQAIERGVERRLTQAVRQLEAYANLQQYVQGGELLPDLHGWPISPDFALLLIATLEGQAYDAVIEFGSGSSTLLIARVLRRLAGGAATVPHLAFEHMRKYLHETRSLLERAGFAEQVDLVHAPLQPFVADDGAVYNYYDGLPALRALDERLRATPSPRILAVVDGPPANSGPLARYPALELILRVLQPSLGDLLLDDYARDDEKEIVRRWQAWLAAHGYATRITEHALEKGGCTLRFWRA